MIDRRYHRSLQLFTWLACGAMTVKLVFFTEYGTKRGRTQPHVFTGIQQYADKTLDEFFGVGEIAKQADAKKDTPAADTTTASDRH